MNGRKYACPTKPEGCNGCSIVADAVEAEIVAQVQAALDTPALQPAGDDDLAEAIADDEAMLDELARNFRGATDRSDGMARRP